MKTVINNICDNAHESVFENVKARIDEIDYSTVRRFVHLPIYWAVYHPIYKSTQEIIRSLTDQNEKR